MENYTCGVELGQDIGLGRERFWEDRHHATANEADEHLHRCRIYIDLNMGRAGVVSRPGEWAHSGYREIQEPQKRYAAIDIEGWRPCVALRIREIFKEHTANGSSKQWKTPVLCARTRWSEALAGA
ncbi:MAG: hypothetical protein WCH75_06130 [Candidatus Binatia bacterium]